MTPAFFAADIRSGRLSKPFAVELPDDRDYWLVYRIGSENSPNLRDFKRWILNAADMED